MEKEKGIPQRGDSAPKGPSHKNAAQEVNQGGEYGAWTEAERSGENPSQHHGKNCWSDGLDLS